MKKLNFGLASKIAMLLALPFLAYFASTIPTIRHDLQNLKVSQQVSERLSALNTITEFADFFQAEVVYSAIYAGGGLTFDEVKEKRAKVDNAFDEFEALLKSNIFFSVRANTALQLNDELKELREITDRKSVKDVSIILEGRKQLIQQFHSVYEEVAKEAMDLPGVSEHLRAISSIEDSKYYAHLLLAHVTSLFYSQESLTDSEFDELAFLYAALQMELSQTHIVMSPESQKRIMEIKHSDAMQSLTRGYYEIRSNHRDGVYNYNINSFTSETSEVISRLSGLVNVEINKVYSQVQSIFRETTSTFWSFVLLLIFVTIAIVAASGAMIKGMTKSIWKAVKDLKVSSTSVSHASRQLAISSQAMSADAASSANAIEKTVSNIRELNEKVTNNAWNAKSASKLSEESSQTAAKGEKEIGRLVASMQDISESSLRISEITKIIDEIAFQTNLLSLNAAVEAARAGEHGKGFAVVADAVSNLAQRSAVAARDIEEIVKDTVKKTEQGFEVASSGSKVLNDIVVQSREVASLISSIASASEEQTEKINSVTMAINKLDISTQANVSAAKDSAVASKELWSQSNSLNKVVNVLARIIEGGKNV